MTVIALTDNDYKEMILSNVDYYESKEEFMRTKYYDMKNATKEECLEEFEDTMENGFIDNITCGTYNGVLDIFDPWTINDDNIVDTLINYVREWDFIDIYYDAFSEDGKVDISKWTPVQWAYEMSEFYYVVVIGQEVFVDRD